MKYIISKSVLTSETETDKKQGIKLFSYIKISVLNDTFFIVILGIVCSIITFPQSWTELQNLRKSQFSTMFNLCLRNWITLNYLIFIPIMSLVSQFILNQFSTPCKIPFW